MTEDELIELLEEGPQEQRMIIIKVLGSGDIHAETNEGEMIVINMEDRTVKSFLDGDRDWVHGEITNPGTAWEVIGFYFGLTNGSGMERVRNEPTS